MANRLDEGFLADPGVEKDPAAIPVGTAPNRLRFFGRKKAVTEILEFHLSGQPLNIDPQGTRQSHSDQDEIAGMTEIELDGLTPGQGIRQEGLPMVTEVKGQSSGLAPARGGQNPAQHPMGKNIAIPIAIPQKTITPFHLVQAQEGLHIGKAIHPIGKIGHP